MKALFLHSMIWLLVACDSQPSLTKETDPGISHSICNCRLILPIRIEPMTIVVAADTVLSEDLDRVFGCLADTLAKNAALGKAFLDRSDVISFAYMADTVASANAQLIDEANRFTEWKGSFHDDSMDVSVGMKDRHAQFKALIAKGNYRYNWEKHLKRIVGTDVKWSYNIERVATQRLVIKGYKKPFYPVGFDLTLRRLAVEK